MTLKPTSGFSWFCKKSIKPKSSKIYIYAETLIRAYVVLLLCVGYSQVSLRAFGGCLGDQRR